jgi:hypothetical protein
MTQLDSHFTFTTLYWCSMTRHVTVITWPSSGGTTRTQNWWLLCAEIDNNFLSYICIQYVLLDYIGLDVWIRKCIRVLYIPIVDVGWSLWCTVNKTLNYVLLGTYKLFIYAYAFGAKPSSALVIWGRRTWKFVGTGKKEGKIKYE